jgi:hypothetical protein
MDEVANPTPPVTPIASGGKVNKMLHVFRDSWKSLTKLQKYQMIGVLVLVLGLPTLLGSIYAVKLYRSGAATPPVTPPTPSTPVPARQSICGSASISSISPARGTNITIKSSVKDGMTANYFSYPVYNLDNLYSPANPKPVCVKTGGDYTGNTANCPSGTYQLTFLDPNTTTIRQTGSRTVSYANLFVTDASTGKALVHAQILAYFELGSGPFSLPDPKCVVYANAVGGTGTPTPTPTPKPTFVPRPTCPKGANCMLALPPGGWCLTTPTPVPAPTLTITTNSFINGQVGISYRNFFYGEETFYTTVPVPTLSTTNRPPGLSMPSSLCGTSYPTNRAVSTIMAECALDGIPTTAGNYQVKVTLSDNVGHAISKNIPITILPAATPTVKPTLTPIPRSTSTPTPAPYIHVLTPNGGESLIVGQHYTITWSAGGLKSYLIDIVNSLGEESLINGVSAPNSSYNWLVVMPAITNTGKYKIKVIDAYQGGTQDQSDGYFTILQGTPSATIRPTPTVMPTVMPTPTPQPVCRLRIFGFCLIY